MVIIFNLFFVLISAFGLSRELVAEGDVLSKEGEKLFTLKQYKKDLGEGREETTVYFNSKEKAILKETIVLQNGEFQSYEIQQNQSGKTGKVITQGEKLLFETHSQSKNEEVQIKTTDRPSDFAIGSSIVRLAQKNIKTLMAGDDVDFKLGLWARQRLINFFLRKKEETKDKIKVKMSPSNFFIRQFVDDIFFTFDKASGNLLEYRGRTNLIIKKGEDSEPLDAVVNYRTAPKPKPLKQ